MVTKVVWTVLGMIWTFWTATSPSEVAIASEIPAPNPTDQQPIPSVSQLSDIQPTDWAFQALLRLADRYGCIADHSATFRENQTLTRFEFAMALNACLDGISQRIAHRPEALIPNEDLTTVQRLQEEFAVERLALRRRVDSLEGRITELTVNQFSPTTKLQGEAIFGVAGVIDEDQQLDTDNDGEADTETDSQVIFSSQVELELNTSFTGEDELSVKIKASNTNAFASDPIGFSFDSDTQNTFVLDQLSYSFPVGDRVQIFIGASGAAIDDFVTSTISPFDSDSGGSGSLSNFGLPAQYSLDPGDMGVGVNIQLTDNLTLDLGYASGEGDDSSVGAALFNGDYAAIGQLTFLSDSFDAAITYVHSSAAEGFITEGPEVANTFGAQVNFRPLNSIQIGGGLAYVNTTQVGEQNGHAWSYQLTLAFPNLGKEGNALGILAGVPLYSKRLRPREDSGFLVEVFYQHKLTDNITITPAIIYISNPFNNNDNGDSILGAIRATFSF